MTQMVNEQRVFEGEANSLASLPPAISDLVDGIADSML